MGALPLANFALVKFSDHEFALLHQEHHIVHDGWGGSEFTAELMNWYHSFVSPEFKFQPSPVPQYADFVITQKNWMKSDLAAQQRNYWVEQLKDAPQSVSIFGKKSKHLGFEGGHERIDFTRAQWTKCEQVCREMGVTPFGFTTAVLNLMLWQYSGQRDIILGAPFANRNWQDSQSILGMLVNTLVLRTKIDPALSTTAFIHETQRVISEAHANQELPFGAVVESLNPERFGGQNPLFNVLLGFHDAPIDVENIDGLNWLKDETVISSTTKFDLDCLVVNRDSHFSEDGMVSFLWEYRSDVYEKAEIKRFVESFKFAFLALCNQQFDAISDVPSVTPKQADTLLLDWGKGYEVSSELGAIFRGNSFDSTLKKQLKEYGERVALHTNGASLTYQELDALSDAVAATIANAVRPNDRVAIYAQRSLSHVVAMVAVLKLRATIICLDPAQPEVRLNQILDDSKPCVVLCDDIETSILDHQNCVLISKASATDDALSKREEPQQEHVAYVTYTSGSTGRPKGVELLASGLQDECLHLMSIMSLNSSSVGLSLSYTGFDAYHGEIWPLLLSGSTICLVSDAERDDFSQLSQLMHEFEVTCACLPTGLLEAACNVDFDWPKSLKTLAVGGDRLSNVSFPADFSAKLLNLYGPTETTIDATFFDATAGTDTAPPIGRPAAFTSALVLDGSRLCPIGGPGELVIGGTGVAKGYLNLPDETAKSFVTVDQFPGDRFYRTGDKVRWRFDGQLEFLGRIDDEIKLRGYRIAPAEILTAIQAHEDVSQAAVAVKQDALFAYVTVQPQTAKKWADISRGRNLLSRQLKGQLKKKLPKYMCPNAILVLDRLPLTAQGKIDNNALPSPLEQPTGFQAASTATELIIHKLWANALDVEKLSVNDNFFSVGGHSLLAIRLINTIRQELNTELKINDFFDRGTIRELSEYIDLIAQTSRTIDDYQIEGEL